MSKKEDKEVKELADMIAREIMDELSESESSKSKDMLIDARTYGISLSIDGDVMIIRAMDIVGLPNGHTVTFIMPAEVCEGLAHKILEKIKPKEMH